ncbi:Phox homologous domain-containing protein [Pseudomassariella vexata]|uniref:Endosomal/vacuolar adapter protein YPT35 n=1 Tax=Pseudomassariella vexata TaxID=1141098 RepID=A0A1Y2D7I6_9PEZI|nr:Phox homologous domain-containing protein [Pseudomassariella vexata]ORY54575.1 Phox homologous domain-containing protein [Pseudomassariella vexata]
MASAIAPQHLNGSGGLNGSHKVASGPVAAVEAPPSPPATETDTEEPEPPPPALPARPEQLRRLKTIPHAPIGEEYADEDEEEDEEEEEGAGRRGEHEEDVVSPSSITSPPYWPHGQYPSSSSYNHHNASSASVDSLQVGGITLQDNDVDDRSSVDDRNRGCWAKSVDVTDYVVVNGSATNIGAFVVFNIRVQTLNGSYMNIRKRYSEFNNFRWRLIRTFPNFEAAVPELPPKSLISKFRPRFLEKRRAGLQYFLNCILLNPEFSGSPVLKEFLFS